MSLKAAASPVQEEYRVGDSLLAYAPTRENDDRSHVLYEAEVTDTDWISGGMIGLRYTDKRLPKSLRGTEHTVTLRWVMRGSVGFKRGKGGLERDDDLRLL